MLTVTNGISHNTLRSGFASTAKKSPIFSPRVRVLADKVKAPRADRRLDVRFGLGVLKLVPKLRTAKAAAGSAERDLLSDMRRELHAAKRHRKRR